MMLPFILRLAVWRIEAKPLCLLLVFCLLSLGLQSQAYVTAKSLTGRQAKLYEQAKTEIGRNELSSALEKVNQLLELSPKLIDAQLLQAGLYHDLGQLAQAEIAYESGLALAPDYDLLAVYQLALTEMRQEKFDEAATHLADFIASGAGRTATRERAAHYLQEVQFAATAMRNPVPFAPYSLGDSINTPNREYLPVLTADGQRMIFTAFYEGNEDFYVSQRAADGRWQKAVPLGGINTPKNEGAQSISADGKKMVFTGCNWEGGLGSCDLYESVQKAGSWTPAANMGAVVNSSSWESQPSLSADGRQLFFASDRPGGRGGLDLWVSRKGPNGRWAKPLNLSDSLNTKFDEEAPFIHPDGQTLYFMSTGHPGMGKSDLFVSRLQPNGQWGKPQNLGYPINTTGHEGALFVDLAGRTAYFTTNRLNRAIDGSGNEKDLDIFAFELPSSIRPLACTYLVGTVVNEDKNPLIGVEVAIYEDGATQSVADLRTDADGQFLLVLPVGKDYAFQAKAPAYAFYSDRFELREVKSITEPYRLDITLSPIAAPAAERAPVVLKNVLFATASAELLPGSEAELIRLQEMLSTYPSLRIRINGHTDDVGEEEDNQKLSEARARAVYDWLRGRGVEAERLSFVGFGETQALAPNDSPEGRAINRRTEFEILGN